MEPNKHTHRAVSKLFQLPDSLSVAHTHNRQRPCEVLAIHPLRYKKIHTLVKIPHFPFESCEILNILDTFWSHMNMLWHHELRQALQVSLHQPQHQMAHFSGLSTTVFPNPAKGARIFYSYHIAYITPKSHTYHYIMVCKGHAYLLYKTG